MFYNGTRSQPAEQILKLSDAYLEKTDSPMLELKVKMININPDINHPILQECRPLFEYSRFIQMIRDYMELGANRDEAIAEAMEMCMQDGIMVDFIKTYGTEVRNMLFTEFNMEDALEVRGEERYAEGRSQGRTEGRIEGKADEIRLIRRKLDKKMSVQEVAALFELDEAYIARIEEFCRKYPEDTDIQIAARYLETVQKKENV